jgi:hypothetical protein
MSAFRLPSLLSETLFVTGEMKCDNTVDNQIVAELN